MAGKRPLHPAPTLPQPSIKSDTPAKVPQPVAQLSGSLLWLVPWAHHVILMDNRRPQLFPFWKQLRLTGKSNGWRVKSESSVQLRWPYHMRRQWKFGMMWPFSRL
jgi:hypothetical protein